MEEGWAKWKLKHERPEKVPGCQDTSQLYKLEPGETDCLDQKCFYYTCQTCSAQLALDIFNPNYEENLHVIPRLSCIKQSDLFTENDGYHVEVIGFYANCLERSNFKGIAVNGWSNVYARNLFDNVEATFEQKNQSKTKRIKNEDDISKKVTDWKKYVSAKCKNNSLSLQICHEKILNSEHKNRPKIDPKLLDLKRDLGCRMTRWNKYIKDKLNKQPPLSRSYNEKDSKRQFGSDSKIEMEKTKEDGGGQGKQKGSNESTQLNNIRKIRRSHSLPGYWKQRITLETKHLKSEDRKIKKTRKGNLTSESRKEVKDFELDWILFDGISITVVEVGEVGEEEPDKKKGRDKNCEKKLQMGKGKKGNDAKDCEMKKHSIVGDKLKQIKRDAIVIRHLLEATGSSDVPVNYLAVFPNLTIGEIVEELERSGFLRRNSETCFSVGIVSSDSLISPEMHVLSLGGNQTLWHSVGFLDFPSSSRSCERWSPTYKHLTSSVVLSILKTQMSEEKKILVEPPSQLETRLNQKQVFPSSFLGPEQLTAVKSKEEDNLLIVDAGSRKTMVVLLALLVKYAAKFLGYPDIYKIFMNKELVFIHVEQFVNEFCYSYCVTVASMTMFQQEGASSSFETALRVKHDEDEMALDQQIIILEEDNPLLNQFFLSITTTNERRNRNRQDLSSGTLPGEIFRSTTNICAGKEAVNSKDVLSPVEKVELENNGSGRKVKPMEEQRGECAAVAVGNRVHAIHTAPVEEEVRKEVITVKTDVDLLLRTTIDKFGKKIEFRAADSYNGFTGKMSVTFPPFSVLGEEKVSLEIVPESFVHAYNEASKKLESGVPEIITPILHVDRENDTSFLRDVELSFPVFSKFFKISRKCQSSDKLLLENGQILLRESNFSPKAVCYDEVEGILRAFRVDTHFSLAFRKLGVYLLVEQFPKNEFLFDLRLFRDEEEHRLYRMDEKKTFRMIANPQQTDSSIYGTGVSITVQEPAVVHNNHEARNVKGNKINFTFPHLGFDIDDFNERKVTVVTEYQSLAFFGVKFQFESPSLNEKGIDRVIPIPLYSEEELTKFSTRRFVQNKGMLLEFLKRLDFNWATFLADYLGVEMRSMKDFIGRDIRCFLPPSVLNWSEGIKRQLKMETDAREFQEVSCREQLIETMLKNYQSSNDLFKAKVEIFEILKSTGVLASDKEYSQGLQPESREILASALMYVPVTKLREAMHDCFVQRKLFSPTPDVDKFIDDGDLPEGEGPEENGY